VRLKLPGLALTYLVLLIPSFVSADVLEEILERGTIRIGVTEFIPWAISTKSGELVGFEIEVANKIASDMNVKPEIRVYEWERIIPALQEGEIDVIASGLNITPARALQVNFSQPIAASGISIAANKEKTKNVTSFDELNDKRVVITVVEDSFAQSVAQTFFDQANIRAHPNSELAQNDVLETRAHAYVATVPEVNFFVLMNSRKVDVPVRETLMASSEGLAVKKGEQELLNFLNSWVVARQTDKWLSATREYWFNTVEWVPQLSE